MKMISVFGHSLLSVAISITALAGLAQGETGKADPLSSWSNSGTKRQIVAFVEAVIKPGKDFVPESDRWVTVDFDGTLSVEWPTYGQVVYCADVLRKQAAKDSTLAADPWTKRVLGTPEANLQTLSYPDMNRLWGDGMARVGGDHVLRDIREWAAVKKHPTLGRTRMDLAYQPMRDLLAWLRQSGFHVVIVTGSASDYVRAMVSTAFDIPAENVIGSALMVSVERIGGTIEVVRQPALALMVDKESKVIEIDRRLGHRPILAIGNSDGDMAMLDYVTSGSGKRLGVLIHHDDASREFAYDRQGPVGKLSKGLDEAASHHWLVVSMKNDWREIFSPGK